MRLQQLEMLLVWFPLAGDQASCTEFGFRGKVKTE